MPLVSEDILIFYSFLRNFRKQFPMCSRFSQFDIWPLGGYADANPNSQNIPRELFSEPLIVALSEKYKKSPAQILIQWNLQRGWGVINTSRRLERVKELVEIHQNTFKLESADMSRINNEIVVRKRYMRPAPFSFLWE